MSINNANKSSELEVKAAHKALNIKITWKQKQQTHIHTHKMKIIKEKYCENKTQIKRKTEKGEKR